MRTSECVWEQMKTGGFSRRSTNVGGGEDVSGVLLCVLRLWCFCVCLMWWFMIGVVFWYSFKRQLFYFCEGRVCVFLVFLLAVVYFDGVFSDKLFYYTGYCQPRRKAIWSKKVLLTTHCGRLNGVRETTAVGGGGR